MKIKKVTVEFVNSTGLRVETHTSTMKYMPKIMNRFSKTAIAKEFKIDLKRSFFMYVSCKGGHKYNFVNKVK